MLNTGPGQVVQGLASYQEMCDVYLVYWVQVQTCLFISTDIYTSTYLNYQYICRVTTPSCCRGRPPVPTRARPPPGPTWASVTYRTRMDSRKKFQSKSYTYSIMKFTFITTDGCLTSKLFHGILCQSSETFLKTFAYK